MISFVYLSTTNILVHQHSKHPLLAGSLAERAGFEPAVPLRIQHVSSVPLSTTQPPLPLAELLESRRGAPGGTRTPDLLVRSQTL